MWIISVFISKTSYFQKFHWCLTSTDISFGFILSHSLSGMFLISFDYFCYIYFCCETSNLDVCQFTQERLWKLLQSVAPDPPNSTEPPSILSACSYKHIIRNIIWLLRDHKSFWIEVFERIYIMLHYKNGTLKAIDHDRAAWQLTIITTCRMHGLHAALLCGLR